jgi:Cu+-exporting ATPase
MKFQCAPQDKQDFVGKLHAHTLMLGDGLNDAGALQTALVGIVVTDNRNNFAPASDGMLVADQIHNLPKLITLARSAVRIVKQSYAVSFFYNIVGLSYAVTGQLSPLVAAILMPVSSIFVVLYGTSMSNRAARKLKTKS